MYLTKISLQPQSPYIRRALADCQQMHRQVSGLFGVDRKCGEILYRLRTEQGNYALYLYSAIPVDRSHLLPGMCFAGERNLQDWLDDMASGQVWGFDLLAVPAKKVPAEGRKYSQRRILRTEEERMAWLARKGDQYGFRLLDVQEQEYVRKFGRHSQPGGTMYLDAYHYNGVLQIQEEAAFRIALTGGIGAGKAYGMGMLLLKRLS